MADINIVGEHVSMGTFFINSDCECMAVTDLFSVISFNSRTPTVYMRHIFFSSEFSFIKIFSGWKSNVFGVVTPCTSETVRCFVTTYRLDLQDRRVSQSRSRLQAVLEGKFMGLYVEQDG
jgi:hypothetical protein